MTVRDIAISAELTIVTGLAGDEQSIPVNVRVEARARNRAALVIQTSGATWHLTMAPAPAAYVAGRLAGAAGVRFAGPGLPDELPAAGPSLDPDIPCADNECVLGEHEGAHVGADGERWP